MKNAQIYVCYIYVDACRVPITLSIEKNKTIFRLLLKLLSSESEFIYAIQLIVDWKGKSGCNTVFLFVPLFILWDVCWIAFGWNSFGALPKNVVSQFLFQRKKKETSKWFACIFEANEQSINSTECLILNESISNFEWFHFGFCIYVVFWRYSLLHRFICDVNGNPSVWN